MWNSKRMESCLSMYVDRGVGLCVVCKDINRGKNVPSYNVICSYLVCELIISWKQMQSHYVNMA